MIDYGCNPLNQNWQLRLRSYLNHKNDEHLEALAFEALDFFHSRFQSLFIKKTYWAQSDIIQNISALLFLIDMGVVQRDYSDQRSTIFRPTCGAELHILSRPDLLPIAVPLLELIQILRQDVANFAKNHEYS